MMRLNRVAGLALLAGLALAIGAGPSSAGEPHVPGAKKIGQPSNQGPIPSLAVLNSKGATLEGNKLTMTGIFPNSIVFADRPYRAAGHVLTSKFIEEWGEGKDSFAKDPPNATISVLGDDGTTVDDAVVVLKSPKIEGDNLTFDVTVLEGDLAGAKGSAALFIDWFAVHGGGWGHGAWYGAAAAGAVAGAAVGAAVASSHPYYPPPACGYYPYPPCY
ncbi:MAG: hypothetical protein JNJ53_12580 [Rhizobiales bacterium]|nr:hypothetical protein [Hyphomicrobiales bacterium]